MAAIHPLSKKSGSADPSPDTGASLLAEARRIAREVATLHADDVDQRGRFPQETFAALREARLLSAPVPTSLGGPACTMAELGEICMALSQGCGASGMVLAMHYIQVACIARHALSSEFFRDELRALVAEQRLYASATSEVGTGGDTRSSICAVEIADGRLHLEKACTTVSYADAADAILVTCRRAPGAAASDQSHVFCRKEDLTLTQTSAWDSMGMRGTCSPGFQLVCDADERQILPAAYADISDQSMVPYSHILWSAVWTGIAGDAVARAGAFVRANARRNPGTVPPMATGYAETTGMLQTMRSSWRAIAAEFDAIVAAVPAPGVADGLATIGWALKMNNLKTAQSNLAPQVVHRVLQVIGILAYRNDTPYSIGRHYRDALSASLMIANDRIASKSASMLLVHKDE